MEGKYSTCHMGGGKKCYKNILARHSNRFHLKVLTKSYIMIYLKDLATEAIKVAKIGRGRGWRRQT